jgi:hypothetical protein
MVGRKFVVLLKCSKCGELVAVSAIIVVEPNYDENGDWQSKDFLNQRACIQRLISYHFQRISRPKLRQNWLSLFSSFGAISAHAQ